MRYGRSFTTTAIITISTNTGGDGSNLDYGSANPHFADNGATAAFSSGTVFDTNGQVTLTLTNRRAETITITASDGVAANGSANVSWTPAAALLLEIQTIPAQVAGSPFDVTIHVTDQFHNLADVVADTGIQLQVAAGTGTIPAVKYDRAEGNVVLRVSRTSGPALAPGDCAPFTVAADVATRLAIEPLGTQAANIAFAVVVDVLDDYDNPSGVIAATTLQLDLVAGTGTLGGTLERTVNPGGRSATFSATYDLAEASSPVTSAAPSSPAPAA